MSAASARAASSVNPIVLSTRGNFVGVIIILLEVFAVVGHCYFGKLLCLLYPAV